MKMPDAVSDAQVVADGAMDSGSTTLTSASRMFTKKDVNKTISVQSAGGVDGSNQPLVTTIATFISPAQVTLAAAATQTVSAQGVIWGTDNMKAFQAWAAALSGQKGVIPSGNYLVNTQGNTQSITLGSNEDIVMERSGAIYLVGANLNVGGGLFFIPSGTSNLVIDSFHVIGEWQNTATLAGIWQGYGNGAVFYFENGNASTHHVIIRNGLFENLLGMMVQDLGYIDYDITIYHNTIENFANTGINVNTDNTSITHNFLRNGSTGMELSGSQCHYKDNTCINSRFSYAIAIGGRTGGKPSTGTEVTGNIVISPQGLGGGYSVGDGFSDGMIANNFCLLDTDYKFGFVVHQDGPVATTNNLLESNSVVAPGTTGNMGFYISGVKGNLFRNNRTDANVLGIFFNASVDNNSAQNSWNGLTVDNSSSGRFQDYLIGGTFVLTRGSTVSSDTVICDQSGIIYPKAAL